jgi:hypothetical protein
MKTILMLPILLVSAWLSGCSTNQVYVSSFSTDDHIRAKLLAHTPLGSSGTNVLRFVTEDLRPHPKMITRNHWALAPHNTIDVELGEYPDGLFFTRFFLVKWVFDDQKDVLTDIVVDRHTVEGHTYAP